MGGSRSGNSSEQEPRGGRKLVERVLRETVRRVVETGVEKITEGPENLRNFVSEMKLPKDIASYLLLQIDETKTGIYGVVAKEIRTFLERTNLAEQVTQALGALTLEIKTEIRFLPTERRPNGPTGTKPQVKTSVRFPPDPSASEDAPMDDVRDSDESDSMDEVDQSSHEM